jgi:putative DNA primase/helicase
MAGAAVLGHATRLAQPKAIILLGGDADNGKSQLLFCLKALLPSNAVTSIPAHMLTNEHAVVQLRGALLNIAAELSSGRAIVGDTFKQAVTADLMTARTVYLPQIFFYPIALHVFATNKLPQFDGGIDRGVERRLLIVTFNRKIPVAEQIERIGERIAAEECDLLLRWAVCGAARLLARGAFTIPPSAGERLRQWLYDSDPLRAWVEAEVDTMPDEPERHSVTTAQGYQAFCAWAKSEGFSSDKLPVKGLFTRQVPNYAPE